jgi:hypothetical protein
MITNIINRCAVGCRKLELDIGTQIMKMWLCLKRQCVLDSNTRDHWDQRIVHWQLATEIARDRGYNRWYVQIELVMARVMVSF